MGVKSAAPAFRRGHALPYGATPTRAGINFSIFSSHATEVVLVLYPEGPDRPALEYLLDPRVNRTGDVWHALVTRVKPPLAYAYRMDRKPNDDPKLHRFDPSVLLVDPYAKAVIGGEQWGNCRAVPAKRRLGLALNNDYDWGEDQPLNIPLAGTVIYELHVRGFTQDPSSGAVKRGTFAGLAEKIPYLKQLGITAVELLPINEFEECDTDRINPLTGERLLNYWGYHPINFFAPNASYAAERNFGSQVREFKDMVKAFHAAGIEIILDVVFNHTSEGDARGPTYSFRGIDNEVYYMVDSQTAEYRNYSGCGNTFNCNHPVARQLIVECLRYWVTEMHVDGFRFDLASILGRGRDGSVLTNPPLLEALAADPVLSHTKLIAEAWDAAGLYQVGSFPAWERWAEWNGRYRDDLRRFLKSDPGMVASTALRLTGSPDLYEASERDPCHSINFITCHDGFTLADLVSYQEKRNLANGEGNRDGADQNLSWNCGTEGPTEDASVVSLRRRQAKNMAALLLLSQGVPMILAGDEARRTQLGNNNAYCQDNELSWFDWRLVEENADLVRFFRLLIEFRRRHASLRPDSFTAEAEGGPQVRWHGVRAGQPDWSYHSRTLAMQLSGQTEDGSRDELYAIANAHWEPHRFELPAASGMRWTRFLDTSLPPPEEIAEIGAEAALTDQQGYVAGPRSVVVLVGRPSRRVRRQKSLQDDSASERRT